VYNPNLGRWMNLDPIGFTAGDVNLYRAVSNSPVVRLDPTGLADKVEITWGPQPLNTEMADLNWTVRNPIPPKIQGLKITSHVRFRWKTWNQMTFCVAPPSVVGSYEFWFDGMPTLGAFQFHLSPNHGSNMGSKNTSPFWPIFDGPTVSDKERQYRQYIADSLGTHGSRGELEILIDYRGYTDACAEKFNDPIKGDEDTGPVNEPTFFDEPPGVKNERYYIPNWIRAKSGLRTNHPWLDSEPKLWSTKKPVWEYVKKLSVEWHPKSGGTSGSYRLSDGDEIADSDFERLPR
jgi:hypothetical protein